MPIRLIHLTTGPDGQSHVSESWARLEPDELAQGEDALGVRFAETPSDPRGRDWHVAPMRQYVITLSGRLEFTTRDGTSFELGPGDVLLAEDTSGGGHRWRFLDEQPWRRVYVQLARS